MKRENVYAPLGASNHSRDDRTRYDYYATSEEAVEELLIHEAFAKNIWEPAAGECHISDILLRHGYNVRSSDIIRCRREVEIKDFLFYNDERWDGDIITNPPYATAQEFVEHALRCVTDGHKVAMLLRIQFLEGIKRRRLFDRNPPLSVYVPSKRFTCAREGDFEKYRASSAMCICWFVWLKGFCAEPKIKWINR